VWAIKESLPVWSGALATAAEVVFHGTLDQWFKAVDARNGKMLSQSHRTLSAYAEGP
jgi:lanthanide-dependent methanol dehydrogenase